MNGYAIPGGPRQLDVLPWARIDQISIEFSGPVEPRAEHLTVRGARVHSYGTGSVHYNPNAAHTATWRLARPIEADRVTIRLDSAPTPGGLPLDGDWSNGADAYPSGDGTPGGDFAFRLNVLAGDVTRTGVVLAEDFSEAKRKFFSSTMGPGAGAAAYSIFYDVNGSGSILADVFSEVKRRFFSALPAAGPMPAASLRREILQV